LRSIIAWGVVAPLCLAGIAIIEGCGGSAPPADAIPGTTSGGVLSPGVPVRMASNPKSDYQVLDAIRADLAGQAQATQPYLRYFTLEAWYNLGTTPVLVSADWERAALIKMLNFLSTASSIVQPTPIDSAKFVYRVDMRQLNWTAAAWDNIKATDPYFNPSQLPSKYATAAHQTVRADWFVSNIPNSPIDAYFVFLGIDSDDPTIDAKNGVDRFADMASGAPATVRGGVSVSGTEAFNRILSWHATSKLGSGAKGSGHLFKSYNFDDDIGVHDIFSHPYEPTVDNPGDAAYGDYDFTFADSDSISTLPNGLNFYYTTIGPDSPAKVQSVASAGEPFPGPQFCFQCHDTATNMIPFSDQVHDVVASDPRRLFSSPLKTLLLGMYDQKAYAARQTAAGAVFGKAMTQLNLPVQESVGVTTESCNVVTGAFSVVLQVGLAAAELGVTPDALVSTLRHSPALASAMGSLVVRNSNGVPNGSVRRDLWESNYDAVRAALYPQYRVTPAPSPSPSPAPSPAPSPTPEPSPSATPMALLSNREAR
jgi:hypothetical protein